MQRYSHGGSCSSSQGSGPGMSLAAAAPAVAAAASRLGSSMRLKVMGSVQGTNFVTCRALDRCSLNTYHIYGGRKSCCSRHGGGCGSSSSSIGSSSSSMGNRVVTAATEKNSNYGPGNWCSNFGPMNTIRTSKGATFGRQILGRFLLLFEFMSESF